MMLLRAGTLLLFYFVLVKLAIRDYKERKIRNRSIVTILFLSILSVFTIPEISLSMRVLGMFLISIPMAAIGSCFPGSFGGGDVKLVFACGAFLGWRILLEGTVLAIFMAGLYCLWMICIKRKYENVQFAMGPFLSTGFVLSSFTLF